MFATYDYTNFPEVKVIFNGSIQDESDYILFTEQWVKLYEDKKYFNFLFDMENMSVINPRYCYKIASFINDIKSRDVQYLTESSIINVNNIVHKLLQLVFMIQSPVSKVTIHTNDGYNTIINP